MTRRRGTVWTLARGTALGAGVALLLADARRLWGGWKGHGSALDGVERDAWDDAVSSSGAASPTVEELEARAEEAFAKYKREREEKERRELEARQRSNEPIEVKEIREVNEEASAAERVEEKRAEAPEQKLSARESPTRATSARAPAFLEPFVLRSIQAERTDAFAREDSRENRCFPKEIDRTLWGAPRALDFIVPIEAEAWPQNCEGRESLCDVLRRVARNREVLAAVANSQAPGLNTFLETIMKLKIPNFLIIALDKTLTERLDTMGVSYYFHEDPVSGNHKVSAKKFALIQEFVTVGCSVLLTDTDVTYQQNPFAYLYRDSDIESMSDGFDNDSANGFLQRIHDGSMGAAHHRAGSFRVSALNSGMWYVSATHASLRLMKIMAHRMATEDLWDQSGYNVELWFASRDAHMTSGATVRVMDPFCFMNSKVMFRIVRHTKSLQREKHLPVAMHANYHTDKEHKIQLVHAYYSNNASLSTLECTVGCGSDLKTIVQLESGHEHNINDGFVGSKNWKSGKEGAQTCEPMRAWNDKIDGLKRTLHVIEEQERVCSTSAKLRKTAKKICDALSSKLSLDKHGDVILIVADSEDAAALDLLIERGIKSNMLTKQTLVVTSDEGIAKSSQAAGVATVLRQGKRALQKATLKWYTIHSILRDGHGVVFIDPSVVLMDDPSKYFYRDSDLESASDGWDDQSAYGYDHVVDDPSMGWSRYLHGGRVASSDSGFFRLAPTHESVFFAERIMTRLTATDDATPLEEEQDVFNAAIFFPSYGDFASVGIIRRTLNYLCFANSKTVFLFMRKDKQTKVHHPIMIDFSYHVRDIERMKDTYAYYSALKKNDARALSEAETRFVSWSVAGRTTSEGETTAKLCQLKTSPPTKIEINSHELASNLIHGKAWSWAGVTEMKFLDNGELETPWGKGKWSFVKSGEAKLDATALWADFAGAHHLLKFETPEGNEAKNSMFVSERCSDGTLVVGREVRSRL